MLNYTVWLTTQQGLMWIPADQLYQMHSMFLAVPTTQQMHTWHHGHHIVHLRKLATTFSPLEHQKYQLSLNVYHIKRKSLLKCSL